MVALYCECFYFISADLVLILYCLLFFFFFFLHISNIAEISLVILLCAYFIPFMLNLTLKNNSILCSEESGGTHVNGNNEAPWLIPSNPNELACFN